MALFIVQCLPNLFKRVLSKVVTLTGTWEAVSIHKVNFKQLLGLGCGGKTGGRFNCRKRELLVGRARLRLGSLKVNLAVVAAGCCLE